MGVFRTFVSAIALMMTMSYLWSQNGTLSPYLTELKDTSIYMGYPITNNIERLRLSDNNSSNLDHLEDDEDEVEVSEGLIPTNTLSATNNATDTTSLAATLQQAGKASRIPERIHKPTLENVNTSACFSFADSKEYWNMSLLRNIDHDRRMVDANYLYETLLDPWSARVMNQTPCHENSRFLDSTPEHMSDQDWQIRLLYLGIYLHQHLPAMKDIESRKSCQADQNSYNSPFNISSSGDYQCDPNTKYLVVSLPTKGAGATFRAGAVPALLAGLALNRVVVFVNDRPFGNTQMKSRWPLASKKKCPRGDIQCYFLPVTPCVLTEDEVKNATQFAGASAITVLADGRPGKGMNDHKILVVTGKSAPLALNRKAEKNMRARISNLVKDVAQKYGAPKHVLEQILRPHLDQSLDSNGTDPNGLYNRATSGLHHAGQLYLMRPNSDFRQEINIALQKALPKDFDPEWSFGIPVRASDKCGSESTCLTFHQYMQLALQQYNKFSNGSDRNVASIVLTSEAASMMAARHNYNTSSEFPFRFVVNDDDVTQGTGRPRDYRFKDAHSVMLSTMVAIKLQLLPKYSVANCCSSFHQVMLDLLRVGCGAVKTPDFRCLQETDDPHFHVCCEWSRDEPCLKQFEEFRKVLVNNTSDFA